MKRRRFSFAVRISILYAVISGIWILLSDRALTLLFPQPDQWVAAQTYKGWFFVVVTALLLFILIRTETRSQKGVKKQYSDLFNSAAEGIFRSSPDGQYINVNPAMAHLYGYSSPEEMLESIREIGTQIHLSEESRRRFTDTLKEQDVVEKFEAQNLRKDGSVFWTSTNARVIRDENGGVLYYEGFVTDITERKAAESGLMQAEARYKAIVEQMPAALYTDAVDKISSNFFSSPQVLNITGYSPQEWIEDPELWIKLIHPEDRQRVLEENERTNQTREPFDIEYRIISRDGRVVWVHDMATPICDEDGNPLYWQGLLVDVTSQQYTEEAIKASEIRYHTLIEQASDAIFISDAQGKYFEVNQRACDLLGFSRAELLNLTIRDLLTPEELAVRPLKLHELSHGRAIVSERALLRRDRKLVPVELSTKMLPDGMLMTIARDVTERKLSQETLARSEKRFRSLIEHSMDAIALYSADGKILYQSPAAVRILGYTLAEMLGRNILDFIHPADQGQALQAIEEVLQSPGNSCVLEIRCLHKDGTTKWVEIINTNRINDPGVNAIVSNYRDTTERRLTEEALRGAESRYRALVENIPPVVYVDSALDQNTIYISPQIQGLLGYTPEEWLSDKLSWSNCVHPDDSPQIIEKERRSRQTGDIFSYEYRMIARDGRIVWVHDQASLICDGEGNKLYWQGIFTDITERKTAEARLQEAEQKYRALVEELPAVVFMDVFNQHQSTQYISPRIYALLGYTPEEWIASDSIWENSLHPDDKERVIAEDTRTNETGQPFRIEYRMRTRNGNYIWVREDASIIKGSDGTPLYWQGIILDITEHKLVQEALRRRESILEAVGFAAEQFLKSADWHDCIPQVLEQLGKTTDTSRVYVFKKHHSADNTLLISQLFEWCASGIEAEIDNETLQNMDFAGAGYTRWIDLFNQGLPAYGVVKKLPPEEQVEFSRQGILSIICFPIPVNGEWWGFIGFDDCRTEREWSVLEVETLRAAVSTLGAAIQRKSTEEALFTGESSYQGLFNSVDDAIYIHDLHGHFLDVNDGAVRMYGYPKEFFIGKTPAALGAPGKNNLQSVMRSFKRAVQGEHQRLEFWGLRSNGEVFPKEVNLYKGVYFGNEVVIGVAKDITERKHAEDALQRQLKELTVLHSIALAESSARDSDELIQRVTDIIGDTLYTDNCGVLLSDKHGNNLQPHFSYRGTNPGNVAASVPVSQGISGKVLTTREPIRVGDVTKEPAYYEVTADVRSELCVPIISGDRAFGVLNVESKVADAFTEADERLLNTIAGGMATALERLQLFEVEQKRREDSEILRQATATLTTSVDLDEVFEIILFSLSKLVSYTSSSIELLDGNYVEIVAERGLPSEVGFVGTRYDYHADKWGKDLGRPIIIADVRQDERFEKLPGTEYIRSWMGLPMLVQEKLLGYLNLDSDKVGFFTEEHAPLLQIFANQAAIAIDNARLFEEEKRRTGIIEALAEIANEIAATGEMSSLLDKVAKRTRDLLRASHVAIYLLQDDNETIKIVNAHGSFSRELLSHSIKIGEGITGNVIASGKSEIVNDTSKDTRRITVPGTSEEDGKLETLMLSPLIVRGKPIGSINAWRLRAEGLFNEAELNFLISIAHQTSISIEAARLLGETTRRAQETAAIAEVGRDISATLQLDLVLERIAAYAKELLKTETSAVYLFEPANQSLRVITAFGRDAAELKNFSLELGKGIVGNIAINKIGEIVNDTAKDSRGVTVDGTQVEPNEHIMGVPVLSKGELTGLLAVWRTGADQLFVQRELEFLTSLAQQAAVAIENARLFEAERKRREEAENLRMAATAITSTLEPGQVLETILLALKQVVPYDSAAIFQLEGEQARITAAKGFPDNAATINRVYPANNKLFLKIHKTGQPLILEDSQKSAEFERWAAADSVHGWMGVPLTSRGQIIGYITMDNYTPAAFNENDALLAQTFAHHAAAAIENSRLFTETRQRMEELEVVSRVSVALRVAQDSEKMLTILLHEIKKSMDTDTAAIWLYDRDKDQLIQRAASGRLSRLPRPDIRTDEGITGKVFVSGKTHVTTELARDPNAIPENAKSLGEGWGAILVPIQTTSGTIGVLMVAIHSPQRVETHHVSLLKTIAEIAGNAINRSNLFEKSEEQVRRLITLREMDTAISSSFDLRVTLDILVEHLLSKMGVSATAILLLNQDSQNLSYYSGAGFRDLEFIRMHMETSDSLANQILLTQKEIYIPNLEDDHPDSYLNTLRREDFISYYGVPLQSKGLVRGVLEMYFRQPFAPNSDWREFVHTLAGQGTIAIDNTRLFENLQRSNQELSLAYDTTLEGWGKALELRDKETEGHTRRVTELTLELARRMGIPDAQLTHVRRGVLLHDIGKMGVPDNILRKEGPLTDEEWVEMRKHPQHAFDLLYPIHYLRAALDIAYYHHEWWDGSGYPSGLKGNDIPLPARIFAVVDVWDALLSNRPYRKSWTKQKVLKYIRGLAGKQFDPDVVDTFMEMMKGMKLPTLPYKAARKNLEGEISTPLRKKATRKTNNKKMR